MGIIQILILAGLAILLGLVSQKGRSLALLAASAFVIYWLQPATSIVTLAFWLPTATLLLAVLSWGITAPYEMRTLRKNWVAGLVIVGVIIFFDLNRYVGIEQIFTIKTPRPVLVAVSWVFTIILLLIISKFSRYKNLLSSVAILGLIGIFVILKTPMLVHRGVQNWLYSRGDNLLTNFEFAIPWLGFSYVAFRLLHTLRDSQSGRLPSVDLAEYVTYVIFFPAFTSGPIDRIERFIIELRQPLEMDNESWLFAGQRLVVGLFKKFVLADCLAIISITDTLVSQVRSPGLLWLFLYAYSFRIYFDFSGYTDIAIGLGRFMGIRLPENFESPYLKPNLTIFWNSWHITLTQWFRAYFFNPVTRWLRGGFKSLPIPVIILSTQMLTMVLIGLWHGVTWNYVLWGIWHGIGLFLHNRWSEFFRRRNLFTSTNGLKKMTFTAVSIFLTFNYVTLGWVFFALTTPEVSWQALSRLFGVGY